MITIFGFGGINFILFFLQRCLLRSALVFFRGEKKSGKNQA